MMFPPNVLHFALLLALPSSKEDILESQNTCGFNKSLSPNVLQIQ